ncbi:MAG: hypothetical protein ACK55I_02415, partial [bacterium]
LHVATLGESHVECLHDRVCVSSTQHSRLGLVGRHHRGHLHELSMCVEVAITECSVDGEHFPIADSTHGACLCDAAACNGDDHVDVDAFVTTGIRQILGSRPCATPL